MRRTRFTGSMLHGVIVAAVLFLVAGGCGRNRRPDIFLVTLDTTRTDRLGCYGADPTNTPNLDRLAAEGIVFEHARCQAPVTAPSHLSMLTSLYPRTHGILQNQDIPSDSLLLLSEYLKERGYETAAFTSVKLLSASRGFGDGFDHFDEPSMADGRRRPCEKTLDAALRWLGGPDHSKPLFVWVHFFDAHYPFDWEKGRCPPVSVPEGPFIRVGSREEMEKAGGNGGFTDRDRARVLALYSAMVGTVDHAVGRLFDELRSLGRWNDAEVFVLSDHGEGFDHGSFLEHINSIYRPTTRIVFLWKRPGAKKGGMRVKAAVDAIDLFPTVAEIEGEATPDSLEGRSLLPLVAGREEEPRIALVEQPPVFDRAARRISRIDEIYFANGYADEPRGPLTHGERIAVTDGLWTYVFDTHTGDEVFDLTRDPGETINLAGRAEDEEVNRLRRYLLRWRANHPPPRPTPAGAIDPETRVLLESLGYL